MSSIIADMLVPDKKTPVLETVVMTSGAKVRSTSQASTETPGTPSTQMGTPRTTNYVVPKLKGAAMPNIPASKTHKRHHTEKICDLAHHFGLCEHYAHLLDQARDIGFENVKWPTGFTLFHLAAKRNNKNFLDWLVDNDCREIHAIDDFGKKPIDYACPRKRDTVYPQLEELMSGIPAPKTKEEEHYQAVKNGTYVAKKKEKVKGINMEDVINDMNIAQGDAPMKKPMNIMSHYEVEQALPTDYKKCFKLLSIGWDQMAGKWPKGQTLLHWAARNGKDDICHFLIFEYKADPREEDGAGRNAIYHARIKKHHKLAKKLQNNFKGEMQ